MVRALAAGLLILVLGAPPGAAAADPPFLQEPWLRVDSDHLIVYGDGASASLRRLAFELEVFRELCLKLLPNPRMDEDEKLVVFALRDGYSLRRYGLVDPEGGARSVALGWSLTEPERAWVLFVAPNRKVARTVGFHEYAHYVTARATPFLPPWLREGLAEYWGTLLLERDGTLQLGGPNQGRLPSLRQLAWQPFEQLLTAPSLHGNAVVNLYAQSWAFVQYASHAQPEFARGLPAYLEQTQNGQPAAEAFNEVFGMSPSAFQLLLREYVVKNRFGGVRFKLQTEVQPHDPVVRPASKAEVATELGLLHLRARGRTDVMIAAFELALKREPSNGRAQAGLGWALRESDPERARYLLEESESLSPDDPVVLTLLARFLRELEPSSPEEGAANRRRALGLLRQAAESSPVEVRAAAALAAAALAGEAPVGLAIQLLERGLARRPNESAAAALLQSLYLAADGLAAAWTVHDRLLVPSGDLGLIERSLDRLLAAERRAMLAPGTSSEARRTRCEELGARLAAAGWSSKLEALGAACPPQ